MGQYSKKLGSGGEFIVTEKDWRIEYYKKLALELIEKYKELFGGKHENSN